MTETSFNPDTLKGAFKAQSLSMQSEWIQEHLQLPYNKNEGLAKGLLSVGTRSYLGPIKIPFDSMQRVCGPEPDMKFHEDKHVWDKRINYLLTKLREGWTPPPFIVEGGLQKPFYLADGNHRLVAMEEFGHNAYWAILHFENQEKLEEFKDKFNDEILSS